MAKKYFSIIIALILVQTLCAQSYMPRINRMNCQGNREGVWVLTNGQSEFQIKYNNGIRVGACNEITSCGKISVYGRFLDGMVSNYWYQLDDDDNLECMLHSIKRDYHTVVYKENMTYWCPHFRGFYVEYYPNGNVKKEGLLLWSEGEFPLDDCAVPYGIWRTYDKSGHVVHVDNFLFSAFYKAPSKKMTVSYDYKWALSDEPILLPYIE